MKLIGFEHPEYLILLAGMVPLVLWSRSSQADLPDVRRKAVLVLRIAIYLLLTGALSGFRFYIPTDELAVTFLIDHSDSSPSTHLDDARKYISRSLSGARTKDTVKIAFFGDDVNLDQTFSGKEKLQPFSTMTGSERTDISRALSFAQALMPRDAQRRIVLISDGNENRGDALRESQLIGSRGTEIWTVPYPSESADEVMIKEAALPESCSLREPFDLKVTIESTRETKSRMNIFLNGAPAASDTVALHRGENLFFIPQKASKPGTYSYEVQIEPRHDSVMKNNRATAVTFVKGKPRILHIADYESPVASILLKAGMDVTTVKPDRIPVDLADLRNYQSIVMSNVSALSLAPRTMSLIKSFVQDLGGGFTMTGGANSFGIGGYYNTPVEDVLPVDMDVRKKKMLPQIALVLVIDKSGSMADTLGEKKDKMMLAREAAIMTLDFMAPGDMIGVIAFDSAAKWVVTLKEARDKNTMANEIASIRAGGGTDLYSPLESAISEVGSSKAALKHIIVLSDGRTSPGDFEGLIKRINAGHITLSTVSIGGDADIPFMEGLARKTKGRSYYTDDGALLPRIFLKDAFIASHSAILEETFMPLPEESHPAVSGIDISTAPSLKGYCITSAKPLATTVLVSHRRDPILAFWHSGLGKSAAFTSGEEGNWAPLWPQWQCYSSFWLQTVRWTLPRDCEGDFSIRTEQNGDTCSITAEAVDDDGNFINFLHFNARVVFPDMTGADVPLRQLSPGIYGGEFLTRGAGNYIVNLSERKRGSRIFALSVPFSPEYREHSPNIFLLNRAADLSRGRFNALPEDVFTGGRKKASVPRDTWELLLMLALLLFPLDVAARRVFLPENWLRRKKGRSTPLREAAPASTTLKALKSLKRDIAPHLKASAAEEPLPEMPKGSIRTPSPATSAESAPAKIPDVSPALSQDSISYLKRLKQAKRNALPEEKK